MKRKKFSARLAQLFLVTVVISLSIYFLLHPWATRSSEFYWLSTRNLSVLVKSEERTVLVDRIEPSPCRLRDMRLLVAVFSAPRNSRARAVIRKTWARKLREYGGVRNGVEVIFFLGWDQDVAVQKSLTDEAKHNYDIIIEDFHDTYLNLTLKTTFLLKWVSDRCSNAKFVFKVDDDVFVNPERVWSTLDSLHLSSAIVSIPNNRNNNNNNMIVANIYYALIGHVMNSNPIRDPSSKWYLPPTFYIPNTFPSFLSGTAYIFTGSLVPALYHCALITPFINLEDVFLTGLCASEQLKLKLTHNKDFVWRPMPIGSSHVCYYKNSITVHGCDPDHLEEVWPETQKSYNCDSIFFSVLTFTSRVIEFFRAILRI